VKRALAVVGTRPDAIKMAPVILELQKQQELETIVVASGQHREMLDQVFSAFKIGADRNFDVMKQGQTLAYLTSSILDGMGKTIDDLAPDIVIAQGDTTTTFVAGLAAFYAKKPFAHVEAGLRTPSIDSPFPEEFNRRAVALFAALHFPPTAISAANLLREGVPQDRVFVTGNTSIDAIKLLAKTIPDSDSTVILVTTHRRENWGEPQRAICRAIIRILDAFPDYSVVLPMHRNPLVRNVLTEELGKHPKVQLIEPPEYPEFVQLMAGSYLVLTDSGGVQEEAPALGKPVLVLRSETERPEGIIAGNAKLVGTDADAIFTQASELLGNADAYREVARTRNPYGDGRAAQRIVGKILEFLELPHVLADPFDG
jgi:UDP-N-acetylglucosamine 2-epimerase (non-hydrolysing)